MTQHPDPLDEVLREAYRRGQVVLMHPTAGPVFVHAQIDERVTPTPAALEALARLDQMMPAGGASS